MAIRPSVRHTLTVLTSIVVFVSIIWSLLFSVYRQFNRVLNELTEMEGQHALLVGNVDVAAEGAEGLRQAQQPVLRTDMDRGFSFAVLVKEKGFSERSPSMNIFFLNTHFPTPSLFMFSPSDHNIYH